MAKKAKKKRAAKNTARTKAKAKTKKAGARRPAARRAVKKQVKKKRATSQAAASSRLGVITHTELASADPGATRTWCREVLGWKFGEAMPTPAGPYHMWRFEAQGTGGGIRANNPPEAPGSIPYCEVADIQVTYAKALDGGAIEMLRPEQLPGGMGWVAIVAAPGGVPIGFWAMK